MQKWWYHVIELIRTGKRREAIALTRVAANRGTLAANVKLAIFGEEAGISRAVSASKLFDGLICTVGDG